MAVTRRLLRKLAAESDVVLLMVGDNPHETKDRETLGFPAIDLDTDPDKEDWVKQEPLIDAVLKANAKNTAVILKTSGTVLMPWLDKVPAVLEAWYPRHGRWQCRRQPTIR